MLLNLIMFLLLFVSSAHADDATNHLVGYTGANTLGPFQITQSNGNVGIGTSVAPSLLTVYSTNNTASLAINSAGSANGIDSYTKLMLHLDATPFVDSSSNAYTVTNSSITLDTANKVLGAAGSGASTGASGRYLSIPNVADFDISSGDWTIDFWFLPTTDRGAPFGKIKSSAPFNGYFLEYDGGIDNKLKWYYDQNTLGITQSDALTGGNWYHVALVSSSGTTTLYIGGVSKGTTSSIPAEYNTPLVLFTSYTSGGSSDFLNANIQEFRFSKGIARWTTNFTPPTIPYSTAVIPMPQLALQADNVQEAKFWTDGNDSNKIKIDDATTTRLTISSGNVGIGTTVPAALLDVAGKVSIQTGLMTRGTAPTIGTGGSDCGTSPSVAGNDISGTVTVGSGPGGKCTITFSAAKSSTPNCICQNSTATSSARAANQSTTAFECTGTLTAADKLVYWCPQ